MAGYAGDQGEVDAARHFRDFQDGQKVAKRLGVGLGHLQVLNAPGNRGVMLVNQENDPGVGALLESLDEAAKIDSGPIPLDLEVCRLGDIFELAQESGLKRLRAARVQGKV
jgi:hypothetical protein